MKGIEPSYSAWEAAALPLSYTRNYLQYMNNSGNRLSDLQYILQRSAVAWQVNHSWSSAPLARLARSNSALLFVSLGWREQKILIVEAEIGRR